FGGDDLTARRSEVVQVVRMDGRHPAPAACVLFGKAGEVEIVLAEEFATAIRKRRPGQRRNRVYDQLEIAFARAEEVLRAFQVIDVRDQRIPASNAPGAVPP